MNGFSETSLWIVILALTVGSYVMRFAFIGLMGGRKMPDWLMRHLRYTGVAVLPALVAPLVVWPKPTGGEFSAPHLAIGCATLAVAYLTKNAFAAMGTGAVLMIGYISLFS